MESRDRFLHTFLVPCFFILTKATVGRPFRVAIQGRCCVVMPEKFSAHENRIVTKQTQKIDDCRLPACRIPLPAGWRPALLTFSVVSNCVFYNKMFFNFSGSEVGLRLALRQASLENPSATSLWSSSRIIL